jgi:hypothetical protein
MRIKEIKLFAYGELSEQAKEKAREWYQRFNADDSYWSECVIDDAKAQMNFLGFTIEDIFFSGFWSQGDGACFTGTWSAKDVDAKKLEELYPSEWLDKGVKCENKSNKELNEIATELQGIAKEFPEASASLKHSGHYSHEQSISFDCEDFEKERRRSKATCQYGALRMRITSKNLREIVCGGFIRAWKPRMIGRMPMSRL